MISVGLYAGKDFCAALSIDGHKKGACQFMCVDLCSTLVHFCPCFLFFTCLSSLNWQFGYDSSATSIFAAGVSLMGFSLA
jgi:hypothetical protein